MMMWRMLLTCLLLAGASPAAAWTHGAGTAPPPSGDPTVGVLPSYNDSYVNWSMAGLQSVGDIATVESGWTQCGPTVTPSGLTPPVANDDAAKIQAAINACTAGHVVQLAGSQFKFDQTEHITINKGIVVRGGACANASTPYCSTEILVPNGGIAWQSSRTCGSPNTGCPDVTTVIIGPSSWQWGTCTYGNPTSSACATALTSDAAQGDRTINVSSTTGYSAGMWVRIDEAANGGWVTDPAGNLGQIWASSDFLSSSGSPATGRVAYMKHNPECCGDDYAVSDNPATASWRCAYSGFCDRETAEIHKISQVGPGATLTFDDPLTIAYRTSGGHAALVYKPNPAFVEQAGLENVTIFRSSGAAIEFHFCAYCWMKNVEARGWEHDGVVLAQTARDQIDTSFVTDAYSSCNNGDEYPITIDQGSSEIYVVNSITRFGGKGMTVRAAGAGSVIAYNYIDDQAYMACIGPTWPDASTNASHFAGPHHVLFEGNYAANIDDDRTHGNNVYITYFKNYAAGLRSTFTDPATSAVINDKTHSGSTGNTGNGPYRAAGPQTYNYWHAYVGNVMGDPSFYTAANNFVQNCKYDDALYTYLGCVWMLGWNDVNGSVNDPHLFPGTSGVSYIFRHGNYDSVSAAVNWDANTSDHTLPNSFYLASAPVFFSAGSGNTWPWVDPTASTKLLTLPAKARFDAGTPFVQP